MPLMRGGAIEYTQKSEEYSGDHIPDMQTPLAAGSAHLLQCSSMTYYDVRLLHVPWISAFQTQC